MGVKLAIILDKSVSYLDYERDKVLKSWGADAYDMVTDISMVGEETIFGDIPTCVIQANDTNQVKQITLSIEKTPPNLSGGLIILTTANRNSTRKLEKIVQNLGGTVITAESGNGSQQSNALINKLHLRREVKEFLKNYAGDDYDILVSVLRSVESLPPKHQGKITVEDMIVRLPQPPGSVPPWSIEKPLLNGNINETITTFRTINYHSHPLVVIAILKNKFLLAYRVAALLETGEARNLSQVATKLGVKNNYPLKLAYQQAERQGLHNLKKIVEELCRVEASLKGASRVSSADLMEVSLSKLCEYFS